MTLAEPRYFSIDEIDLAASDYLAFHADYLSGHVGKSLLAVDLAMDCERITGYRLSLDGDGVSRGFDEHYGSWAK